MEKELGSPYNFHPQAGFPGDHFGAGLIRFGGDREMRAGSYTWRNRQGEGRLIPVAVLNHLLQVPPGKSPGVESGLQIMQPIRRRK